MFIKVHLRLLNMKPWKCGMDSGPNLLWSVCTSWFQLAYEITYRYRVIRIIRLHNQQLELFLNEKIYNCT